jgi:hypothetical protein
MRRPSLSELAAAIEYSVLPQRDSLVLGSEGLRQPSDNVLKYGDGTAGFTAPRRRIFGISRCLPSLLHSPLPSCACGCAACLALHGLAGGRLRAGHRTGSFSSLRVTRVTSGAAWGKPTHDAICSASPLLSVFEPALDASGATRQYLRNV